MDHTQASQPAVEHLRLIEGWLPLAQEANQRYGWGLEAQELEALILYAAPQLGRAASALAAQAILWKLSQGVQDQHDISATSSPTSATLAVVRQHAT